MLPLQFSTHPHHPPSLFLSSSNACSSSRLLYNNRNKVYLLRSNVGTLNLRVLAVSGNSAFKMNLNEYLVTLEKPLGIRFALTADGKIIVHSLTKGGNAERSRIIMVGDTLKKAGDSSQNILVEIKDVGDTQKVLNEQTSSFSLVLERPTLPFPIQLLHKMNDLEIVFNRGRVPIVTWNKTLLASNLQPSSESCGNSGFLMFNSKFLKPNGSKLLGNQNQHTITHGERSFFTEHTTLLACVFTEEVCGDGDWAHGSFPLEEYIQALDRSKDEMYYNHSLGMRYSKITEQIYVGSCIQTEDDVETLSKVEGVTAVLNFQSGTEAENWGINAKSINESCQRNNILMINYPIREGDSYDMRKKLPFCVGLLLRLLRKNLRVFVTCTSGFDRSPACVIAYLHWMTDVSLHAAYTWVTGMHTCRPDRPAIAWATWDLIAMVENGKHDGPPTHAVTFVWNGHEGEDVTLVGDFTGNWKEPLKAKHQGGSRHEVEVKLPQGKYYYKFIVNGQWKHSTASPAERDERGNVNNIIVIGETASVRPSVQHQQKDANVVKVIERPLNEKERFMLAKAARLLRSEAELLAYTLEGHFSKRHSLTKTAGVYTAASVVQGANSCEYPAIFNFGDSNSDTGAISAAFTGVLPPNGENFLGSLSGRACDGRLIIDFITEELKLPYLSAYLNSVGSNYRHGANFATGGSSILPGGYSPFHLGLQISQFIQFKSRTKILFYQHLVNNRTKLSFKSSIPRPDDFSRALYTFDIGQNDLAYGFRHTSEEQVRGSILNILRHFSQAVQQLYIEGARVFWIHNTGPIGCLPFNFLSYESKRGNMDANGCVNPQNEIAQEFNRQLKGQISQLRRKLPLAKFTYVDVYKAKYQLVSNARKLGFVNPLKFCCGSYHGYQITCGKKNTENETFYGNACKNPSQLVSWDGIHYSQAANVLIANQILSGAFSDPPVAIGQACS